MRLIILSGDTKKYNTLWIEKIRESLKDNFSKIDYLHYKHWENLDEETIDLNTELKELLELIKNGEKYIICAKTTGILLTLKAIYENKIHPDKCIFIGMPIIWARINNFKVDKWINNYNTIPTLIIQKEEDPAMNYDDLKKYLDEKKLDNIDILKISGKDMYYEEYDTITSIIQSFISKEMTL